MAEVARQLWVVVGNDEQTGELKQMTIESASPERAKATARKNGILATSVKPAGALDYAAPAVLPFDWIICPNPNCGYKGHGVRKERGSMLILVLLLLIGIIPGIIYAAAFSGEDFYCPQCGVKAR